MSYKENSCVRIKELKLSKNNFSQCSAELPTTIMNLLKWSKWLRALYLSDSHLNSRLGKIILALVIDVVEAIGKGL